MEEQDIKRAGLKVTQPRLKILDLLGNTRERHLSAEDIYKILLGNGDEIGLATVYRALTQFEAAGLVNRHHFEGGQAVFELASEEHHDHMVCMRTGRVLEFCDEIIEQRQRELAHQHNFRITGHSLILYGEFLDNNDEKA
ncbi:MAG: ferric iron uptake transcriptional regulator [Thiothrix sp.]|uniref:ferric iron uptake transcriptional regulator n=1 Tax=Thiothrix sp. TaxID=1032 RepID=UPI002611B235|nr:ferric iron uptake transcriptional regulator [Thiothrix sp.]MDD5392145.1 ferric iron uptake transcriptional regulator [Thiothrix sp.]